MVRLYKAELDALIESTANLSRNLEAIVHAVRRGDTDVEVEITDAIVGINSLNTQLRILRKRESPSPIPPSSVPSPDSATPQGSP